MVRFAGLLSVDLINDAAPGEVTASGRMGHALLRTGKFRHSVPGLVLGFRAARASAVSGAPVDVLRRQSTRCSSGTRRTGKGQAGSVCDT